MRIGTNGLAMHDEIDEKKRVPLQQFTTLLQCFATTETLQVSKSSNPHTQKEKENC